MPSRPDWILRLDASDPEMGERLRAQLEHRKHSSEATEGGMHRQVQELLRPWIAIKKALKDHIKEPASGWVLLGGVYWEVAKWRLRRQAFEGATTKAERHQYRLAQMRLMLWEPVLRAGGIELAKILERPTLEVIANKSRALPPLVVAGYQTAQVSFDLRSWFETHAHESRQLFKAIEDAFLASAADLQGQAMVEAEHEYQRAVATVNLAALLRSSMRLPLEGEVPRKMALAFSGTKDTEWHLKRQLSLELLSVAPIVYDGWDAEQEGFRAFRNEASRLIDGMAKEDLFYGRNRRIDPRFPNVTKFKGARAGSDPAFERMAANQDIEDKRDGVKHRPPSSWPQLENTWHWDHAEELGPEAVFETLEAVRAEAQDLSEAFELTRRERQVLLLRVEGASSEDIAQELGVSVNTVYVHDRNIRKKAPAKRHGGAPSYSTRNSSPNENKVRRRSKTPKGPKKKDPESKPVRKYRDAVAADTVWATLEAKKAIKRDIAAHVSAREDVEERG